MTSIDAEETFDTVKHPFIRALKNTSNIRQYLNLIKAAYNKSTGGIETSKHFPVNKERDKAWPCPNFTQGSA